MNIIPAARLSKFPKYLFDDLDDKKRAAQAKGVDVIDLGVGDPDRPTPEFIVKALAEAAANPQYQHYPSYKGLPIYRQAVADWYQRRFGVELNPDTQALSLIGSKIGVGLLPLALCDPGDLVLVPDPCYPAYHPGIILAGAESAPLSLLESNGFLPDFSEIPSEVARRAKLMLLNFPGNPTAAVATREMFNEAVAFACEYEIVIAHDCPYSEAAFDQTEILSFMQIPKATEVGVEFHSCSKAFNMSGWRMAHVVGNSEVVAALGRLRSNIDMGQFEAIQVAAAEALKQGMEFSREMATVYSQRRDVLCDGLDQLGWKIQRPKATFFIWTHVPCPMSSMDFAMEVLDRAGVIITPGMGFGKNGEGFIRIALTHEVDRLKTVIERIRQAGLVYT